MTAPHIDFDHDKREHIPPFAETLEERDYWFAKVYQNIENDESYLSAEVAARVLKVSLAKFYDDLFRKRYPFSPVLRLRGNKMYFRRQEVLAHVTEELNIQRADAYWNARYGDATPVHGE